MRTVAYATMLLAATADTQTPPVGAKPGQTPPAAEAVTVAQEVAALVFARQAADLHQYARRAVADQLLDVGVYAAWAGSAQLCYRDDAACRAVAERVLAPEIDRIVQDLPARAQQALAAQLSTQAIGKLLQYRAALQDNSSQHAVDEANAGAGWLAGVGVAAVVMRELPAIRPKLARAVAALPNRPAMPSPAQPPQPDLVPMPPAPPSRPK